MKRIGIFLCFGILLAALTACGSSKDDDETNASPTKGDTLEVSIEDASYILSGKDSGESINGEAEGGLLQIDLLIKNTSDTSIEVYPDMHIQLYDGDHQKDPSNESNPSLNLGSSSNNNIGSGKQKNVSVLFDVEKDTEYEINIAPMPTDYEIELEDITIPLDTSEYNDSLEALHNPGKALEAYVETIYFGKKNKSFEELVSADQKGLQNEAKDKFEERLNMDVSIDISDKDIKSYYESFKKANGDKAEFETEVTGNANGKAIVTLDFSAISYEDVYDEMKKYKDEHRDEHDTFDREEEDEYALSNFDSILDELEAKSGNKELEIRMKKDDDKWTIDDSQINSTNDIRKVFAEGYFR